MDKVSRDLKFKGKNILVMGLGINQGGLGATKFFANSEANVKVTDLKSAELLKDSIEALKEFKNIEYVLEEHRIEDFDWADLILKNPDVRPGNKYIEYALEKGKPVETDISLFLQYVDRKNVLGITGTKGKSTTSTLTATILKKCLVEDKVMLAGNIGKSMLDVIPFVKEDSIVILELSSFQLTIFDQNKLSIHKAAVTNIYPDHLNYHGTMEEYIKAKKAIAAYQTEHDFIFLRSSDEVTNSVEFLKNLQSQIVYSNSVDVEGDLLPEMLQSPHNRDNLAQALKIVESYGVSKEEALKAVAEFKGVEFRQQLIKTWNGIRIINDTTATTPNASVAAVKSFPGCILIAGGMNKGVPYEELAASFDEYPKSIYFIDGSATGELKKLMKAQDKIKGTWDNFESILTEVKKEAKEGDVVIFSPGGTSFNFFQNEFDRGRKFNAAVELVFK